MVDAGAPLNIYFDPFFWDNQTLILPVWLWIILILCVVGFISLILMVVIWFVMRPVAGYGEVGDASTAKGSPTQTFSIWKNRSFIIERLWYYGNILSYADPVAKMQAWFHNSEKATGMAANKPVMITRDGFDGTVDFIAEMAVCAVTPVFNEAVGTELIPITDENGNPVYRDGRQVMREEVRVDPDGKPYMITSFASFRDRIPMLKKMFPDVVEIDIYQNYDLAEIYRYTPQNHDSLKFGSDNVATAMKRARAMVTEVPGIIDRFGLVIICGVLGFASLGALWYVLPIGR